MSDDTATTAAVEQAAIVEAAAPAKKKKKKYKTKGPLTKRSNMKKKREDVVTTKAAKRNWATFREQYGPFMQDVLMPRAKHEFTSYDKIYSAYLLYCKAVGWVPAIPRTALGILLRENFIRTSVNVVRFGCVIRQGIFVNDDEGEVTEVKI
jgi:hypothetical protein